MVTVDCCPGDKGLSLGKKKKVKLKIFLPNQVVSAALSLNKMRLLHNFNQIVSERNFAPYTQTLRA